MQYKKYVEIVAETETHLIATVWTGPNYYIDLFDRADLNATIEAYAADGEYVTAEKLIGYKSVLEMEYLCRNDDFSQELLDEEIERYKQIIARIVTGE